MHIVKLLLNLKLLLLLQRHMSWMIQFKLRPHLIMAKLNLQPFHPYLKQEETNSSAAKGVEEHISGKYHFRDTWDWNVAKHPVGAVLPVDATSATNII